MSYLTRERLNPAQRQTAEIVHGLSFGVIEGLAIRDGSPCFDPAPRIFQQIKLGSDSGQRCYSEPESAVLKQEFTHLFNELQRIGDGMVDIEVRHSLPFRLVLERHHTDLSAAEKES